MSAGVHQDWPASRFAGQTRFDGVLARLDVDSAVVRSLLPPGIELASRRERAPLGIAFGRQSEGATLFGGRPVPWQVAYEEFVLAVPGVHIRGETRERTFLPHMLTSYFPAIFDGNVHYGYAKRAASMSWDGSRFVAQGDRNGELILLAEVAATADPDASAEAIHESLAAFDAPLLGCKRGGRRVESAFGFDLRGAQTRAAELALYAEPGADGILPAGRYLGRGLHVRGMLWRLAWPRPLPDRAGERAGSDQSSGSSGSGSSS